jgi:hypothetical protein
MVRQLIEKYQVGGFETALALEREQVGIDESGADEKNFADWIRRR